jgi:hypothetical protein
MLHNSGSVHAFLIVCGVRKASTLHTAKCGPPPIAVGLGHYGSKRSDLSLADRCNSATT